MAILLGPYAAFLTTASVLVVQALFFADGGMLALGCNIFNMGFIPAFVVYPLIFKQIVGTHRNQTRLVIATMLSAIVGLQLGPFAVVLETLFSGISSLPFPTFVLLMQPIHLAIGIVEGVVTISVISFVYKTRPDILQGALGGRLIGNKPIRGMVLTLLVVALFTGGVLSLFASKNPDGLEWAVSKVTGNEELERPKQGLYRALAALQETTAFLPDYSFKKPVEPIKEAPAPAVELKKEKAGPAGDQKNEGSTLGTSVSGVLGTLMTLGLVFLCGFVLKRGNEAV